MKTTEELREIAKAGDFVLPFHYDASGQMVMDKEDNQVLDIRGWGRLQYLGAEKAASIQDALGELVCRYLNSAFDAPRPVVVKEFKVVTRSDNRNSFGLRSHILVARDGDAYSLLLNQLNELEVGGVYKVRVHQSDPGGDPTRTLADWRALGAECPTKLAACPPGAVAEIWEEAAPALAEGPEGG